MKEEWDNHLMLDVALDPSYYKDIYKQSEVMPQQVWRDEQPNDTKKNGLETWVFRKLRVPNARKEDAENWVRWLSLLDNWPHSLREGRAWRERTQPPILSITAEPLLIGRIERNLWERGMRFWWKGSNFFYFVAEETCMKSIIDSVTSNI